MAFGYQLLLDMYDCKGKAVYLFDDCYQFLEELCYLLKMNKQSPPFLFRSDEINFPDKAGFSGWLPLIESGIQIHTLEKNNFVSLDIYSCRKFNIKECIEFSQKIFVPKKIKDQFILRGDAFNFNTEDTEKLKNRRNYDGKIAYTK